MKRIISALIVLALALFGACAWGEGAQELSLEGYVVILHTSDWAGDGSMGLTISRVREVRASLEAAGAEVLLIDGGGSLINAAGDDAVILLNEAGYDAVALSEGDRQGDIQALGEAAAFALLGAEENAAALVVEKAGMKIGLMAAPPEADADEAARTVAALREQACDVIVVLGRADGAENDFSQLIALEPQIIIISGLDEGWPEGQWQGDTLLCAARGGLEEIGCVTISPSFEAAAMVIDESWFE